MASRLLTAQVPHVRRPSPSDAQLGAIPFVHRSTAFAISVSFLVSASNRSQRTMTVSSSSSSSSFISSCALRPKPPSSASFFAGLSNFNHRTTSLHNDNMSDATTGTAATEGFPPSDVFKPCSPRASYLFNNVNHRDALDVVKNFQVTPFKPFLIGEPNIQTIVSNFFPEPSSPPFTRITVPTSDGLTHFAVDIAAPCITTTNFKCAGSSKTSPSSSVALTSSSLSLPSPLSNPPVAVVLPGMESNSRAIICRRLTNALRRRGFKVYLLNYRACTGDTPRTLRLYHAGFTEDAEQLLREIRKADDSPPVYVCGFSLGGNILVNLLGRHSYESLTDDFGIIAAGAVAVPFDAAACVNTVDSGWKGMIYSSHLVNETQEKVRRIVANGGPSLSVDLDAVERVNRVGKLDECMVVPVFGFSDRFQYYEHINSTPLLKHITVPTLIINARDDPFYAHAHDGKTLPTAQDIGDAPVKLVLHEHGGHCGFFNYDTLKDRDTGYFQREIARWFDYVEQLRTRIEPARGSTSSEDSMWQ